MKGSVCESRSLDSFLFEMAKNILDVLAPLSFVSKLMGFSSFSINRFDFSIHTTAVDILFRVWIILVNCLLSFCLWDACQHFPVYKSDIIAKSLPIILGGSYFLYLVSMLGTILTSKKQSVLIKSICEIDEMVRKNVYLKFFVSWRSFQLEEFNIRFNYQRQRRILTFALLAVIAIDIILTIQCYVMQVTYNLATKSGLHVFFYYWNVQSSSIFFVNFVVMTNAVKQRFKKINDCLMWEWVTLCFKMSLSMNINSLQEARA